MGACSDCTSPLAPARFCSRCGGMVDEVVPAGVLALMDGWEAADVVADSGGEVHLETGSARWEVWIEDRTTAPQFYVYIQRGGQMLRASDHDMFEEALAAAELLVNALRVVWKS